MPLAGLECFGEDISSLQLGVNIVKAAERLINDLLDAANVHLVGALDVAQLLGKAGLGNNNGGLIILTYLELEGGAFDGVKHGQHGQGLQEEAVSKAHNLALCGGAACGSLFSANPHQGEKGVGPNEDKVSPVGGLGVLSASAEVSIDIQSKLEL